MNQKLVFLDIDGTLTPAGSNVPPNSALRAIRQAQRNGHRVFLCTGRNPGMLAPVLKYGFEGFVGTAGGYVQVGEETLFDCPMTEEQKETALRLLRKNQVMCTIEGRDATWADEENFQLFMQIPPDGNSELIRIHRAITERLGIQPWTEYDGSRIYKIVFMCREDKQLDEARATLGRDFRFVVQDTSAQGIVNGEMINRLFDKGRGVQMVADHFGMSLSDTIGFGDSMNDLEMIETVGCGVCMENGSPHLKEKSDMICPPVEEDGLSWAFEKLGLI